MLPEFDFFPGGGIDEDIFAFEGGDVIGVPRFQITDFSVEVRMEIAFVFIAAGALEGPGFIGKRNSMRARGVAAPTGDGVGFDHSEIDMDSSFDSRFAFLTFLLLIDEDIGRGKGESFGQMSCGVIAAIGAASPKDFGEVAVLGTGERFMAARAPEHFGFEALSGVESDFVAVFAVQGFEVAGERILINPFLKG